MVNLSRDMIKGLVRLRVLHAAASGPISGVELTKDLAQAGHHVSPGTLYPLLHQMEKMGWLKSKGKTVKGKRRRYYRLTKKGQAQIDQAMMALERFLYGVIANRPNVFVDHADNTEAIVSGPQAVSRRVLVAAQTTPPLG